MRGCGPRQVVLNNNLGVGHWAARMAPPAAGEPAIVIKSQMA
jgi:hypothetical protein